jgi:hypothetical protein
VHEHRPAASALDPRPLCQRDDIDGAARSGNPPQTQQVFQAIVTAKDFLPPASNISSPPSLDLLDEGETLTRGHFASLCAAKRGAFNV